MWLIHFHKIQTKDYNRIKKIFLEHNIYLKNLSPTLVSKCLLEHYCQKRSWRKISEKYGIHYSKIYQINIKIQKTWVIYHVFEYLVWKEILIYYNNVSNTNNTEKNIKTSLKMLDTLGL